MNKFGNGAPQYDANLKLASRIAIYPTIHLNAIHRCGACDAEAVVAIQGHYRCQKCANYVVNAWNNIRLNKAGEDS